MATDPTPNDIFESDDFWETHKTKIIGYSVAAILAIGAWGVYEFQEQGKLVASESAFASAKTAEEFKHITEAFPGTIAAGNATLELAEKLRQEKKYDEAVTLLRDFVAKAKDYPLLAGAWTSLAATLELQEKTQEALTIYQEIVTKFPQDSAAPYALAAQGRLFAANGSYQEAHQAYQDLTVRYPESLFSTEARRELQLLKQHQPAAPVAAPASTPEATPADE